MNVQHHYGQALTDTQYLANTIDPRYMGKSLYSAEIDAALEFCSQNYASCLSSIIQFSSQSDPFKRYMVADKLIHSVSPLTWESQKGLWDNSMLILCRQVLGAVSSSAGVERIFSTFGIVHSKLRNRLGADKAGKLVFIYKLLNQRC